MNAISPTQAAYKQLDAWSVDYELRLKRARADHADLIRESDLLLGKAFAKYAGDEPLEVGRALRAATKMLAPYALSLLCEAAIAMEAEEAIDVAPQSDLFIDVFAGVTG